MKVAWGILAVAAIAAVVTLLPAPEKRAGAQESLPGRGAPATYEQQVSYALGMNIGADMRENDAPIDVAALAAGIADAFNGAQPKMTEAQCQAVLERFQKEMQKKAEARMADAATQNKQRGEAFLAENAKKEGVTTTDSGLQYRVIEQGDGATPTAADTVRCHYHGTLTDGTVFDSSYERGQPAEFPVGGVIAGWTEALQLMQVGDKWEVYLPSEIAYGARGAGGAIGPNETLIFTIELLAVVK